VWLLLFRFGLLCRAVAEPEAVIAGFEDVTVMGEAIEQRGGHFRIAEHAGPLAEAQIFGDDDAGAFVEFAQQVEQEHSAK
jgi:hypothetical protein